jgi:hypothetical protein
MIHSQDYHSNHVFNEMDVWYTVSKGFVCLFVCLCAQVI